MPVLVKNYQINRIQQLIDLNQDSTNFKLNFTCESTNPKDKYQAIVISQSELDNSTNLDFKDVTKEIGGDLVVDKNIYQNYFLILKSEMPCEIKVTINKEEIPPNTTIQPVSPNKKETFNLNNSKKKTFLSSSTFLWIVVGVIALVLIYFIFFTEEKSKTPQLHTPRFHMSQQLHTPQSVIHTPQSVIHTPQSVIHTPQSVIHTPQLIPIKKKIKRKKRKTKKKYSFNDFNV